MLEDRISFLAGLLNKYDVNYLNERFKEVELGYVLETFNKVQYSDQLKKRMIAEAKRKSISKSRKEYIQSLIEKSNEFTNDVFIGDFQQAVKAFFEKHAPELNRLPGIGLLFFGHSYDPQITYGTVYGDQSQDRFDNQLLSLKTSINFKPVWGFVEERKFSGMAESLEIISVEEEEYPLIFDELFKLRGYKILKEVLNSKDILVFIEALPVLENFKIEVGEFNHRSYVVFEKNE